MRTVLLAAMLLAAVSTIDAQVSIGITIGPPPPPRVVRVLPESPGPEFVWVPGYWNWVGGRWVWVEGHWERPPHPHAVWVGPVVDFRLHRGHWR